MVEKVGLANIFHDLGLENVARPTFSTIFMILKTSSEIRGKSGKSWPGHVFQAGVVDNIGQGNVFHVFVIPKTCSEIRGKNEKKLESLTILVRATFSTFS